MAFDGMNALQSVGLAAFIGSSAIALILQVYLMVHSKPQSPIVPIGRSAMRKVRRRPEKYLTPQGVAALRWQRRVIWVSAAGFILLAFGRYVQ